MNQELDDRITKEALANGGTLKLDWTNPLHHAYCMESAGGEERFRRIAPQIMDFIDEARRNPELAADNGAAVNGAAGTQDTYQFQTVSVTKKNLPANGRDGAQLLNAADARVYVAYVNHRAGVSVGATVHDMRTKQVIMSSYHNASTTRSVEVPLSGYFDAHHDRSSRLFRLKGDIRDVSRSATGKPVPAVHVIRSNAYLLDTEDDIVKTFDILDPVIKHKENTQVRIGYSRGDILKEYDYVLNNSISGGVISIKLPVTLKLSVQKDYTIDALDFESGFKLYLTHSKGGSFHCMIPDESFRFELSADKKTVTFGVPEKIPSLEATEWSWERRCNITELEETTDAHMDIYGEFNILVYDSVSRIQRPITVSLSNTIATPTKLNLKAEKVWIYWGCLHPDTPVLMSDSSLKRIADIRIGDQVLGHDGFLHKVVNITKGTDTALRRLRTDNGREIRLTPGHPVMTAAGVKKARDIRAKEYVVMAGGERLLVEAADERYNGAVYNLHFEKPVYFYGNTFAVGDADTQQSVGRDKNIAPEFSPETLSMARELETINEQ